MKEGVADLNISDFGKTEHPAAWRNNLICRCCLVLVISGAVTLGLLAESLSWNYPDYIVTAVDPETMQYQILCSLAVMLMSVCFAMGLYLRKKNRKAAVTFALAGIVIFFLRAWLSGRSIIYELQLLMTGGYAIWCWITADFCGRHLERHMAGAVYIAFGVVTLLFDNYSAVYHVFISGRPLTAFYMAAVFSAVYTAVFLKKSEKCYVVDESGAKERRIFRVISGPDRRDRILLTGAATAVITVVFSFRRLLDILQSGEISVLGANTVTTWPEYRLWILKAVLSGNYADSGLDIITKYEVQNFNLLWLGYAFPAGYQFLYIALAVVLAAVLILILRRYREYSALCVILTGSILLGNVLGAAAELNLFHGAQMGLLVSKNIYQILPAACLIAVMNEQDMNSVIEVDFTAKSGA